MDRVFITFGSSVFIPPHGNISADLIVHEGTHIQQQKKSYLYALWWWVKYRFLKTFRYQEEFAAYAQQKRFIVQNLDIKDRNKKIRAIRDINNSIAKILSDPMYGSMVSFNKALADIENV